MKHNTVNLYYLCQHTKIYKATVCLIMTYALETRAETSRWLNLEDSRSTFKILTSKPIKMRPTGRSRHKWEDNIRMDLKLKVATDHRSMLSTSILESNLLNTINIKGKSGKVKW